MKNITHQRPSDPLYGRTKFITVFTNPKDITGKVCLDIGCGYGWMEIFLLSKGVRHIVGIELDPKDLETAKRHIKSKKVSFQVGSALALPFRNEIFDTVFCWDVIEHLPKGTEPKMFSEIYRVIKPTGSLYLSTPNSSLSAVLDPAFWITGHRHYTSDQLSLFAVASHFQIAKETIRGGWWDAIGLLNLYVSKWVFHRDLIFKDFFQKKLDEEFVSGKGFANIFLKLQKLSAQT